MSGEITLANLAPVDDLAPRQRISEPLRSLLEPKRRRLLSVRTRQRLLASDRPAEPCAAEALIERVGGKSLDTSAAQMFQSLGDEVTAVKVWAIHRHYCRRLGS
jgi:hypothetical protein